MNLAPPEAIDTVSLLSAIRTIDQSQIERRLRRQGADPLAECTQMAHEIRLESCPRLRFAGDQV